MLHRNGAAPQGGVFRHMKRLRGKSDNVFRHAERHGPRPEGTAGQEPYSPVGCGHFWTICKKHIAKLLPFLYNVY